MSFKLLAIRPLKGCNKKFLKNLEVNQIYQFYNDYVFQDGNQKKIKDFSTHIEIKYIKYDSSIPTNFYNVKRKKENEEDLEVNISAIVGKNGSGKSSLIELLYVSFYNLSVTEEIIKNKIIKEEIEKFKDKLGDTNEEKLIKLCLDKFLKYDFSDILFFEDYDKETKTFINHYSYLWQIIEIIEKIFIYIENSPFNKIDFPDKQFDKDLLEFRETSFYKHISITYKNKLDNLIVNNFLSFLKASINEINFIEKDVFVEIYFEINTVLYLIVRDKDDHELKFRFYKLENDGKWLKIDFKSFFTHDIPQFFYNLVVNYSLYGLNSEEIGLWVEKVFHKNDGYQTPIVINPFRDQGNIDINSENGLLRDRMMYNMIVNKSLRKVTPNNKVNNLVVSRKNKQNLSIKTDLILNSDNEYYDIFISNLIFFFNSDSDIKFTENSLIKIRFIEQQCLNYIIRKLQRISKNYVIYNEFIFNQNSVNDLDINNENIEKIIHLLKLLQEDKSHITNKLRQAINFIFINRLETEKDEIYEFYIRQNYRDGTDEKVKEIRFKKFSKLIINRNSKYKIDIINLLPPSIFISDYKFQNESVFSYLSSGEKQQIFSLNSILYHLINLNSSYCNGFEYKYPYINLILDEIELYAHPDMQRKYVNELLKGISKLNIDRIKAINILFITHSPFILSDIPKQNVLFLEVDNDKKASSRDYKDMNTFGANITDLLADSFFINEGLMGDFAKKKIQKVINWLNVETRDLNQKDQNKKIIEMIDEPLLRRKLSEMYSNLFAENLELEIIENEIRLLEERKNTLIKNK